MQEQTLTKPELMLSIASSRYTGDEIATLIMGEKSLDMAKHSNSIYYSTVNASNKIDVHIEELEDTFSDRFLIFHKDYERISLVWMPKYEEKLYNLMLSNNSLKYLADMGMSLQAPYFYKVD